MRVALEKIDELISKKGFAYSLIMAQIEDESIAIVNIEKRNNQNRLSGNEILFLWSLLVNKEDFSKEQGDGYLFHRKTKSVIINS